MMANFNIESCDIIARQRKKVFVDWNASSRLCWSKNPSPEKHATRDRDRDRLGGQKCFTGITKAVDVAGIPNKTRAGVSGQTHNDLNTLLMSSTVS
jgi:hypothetical protein